jgi:hypothetical protein
MHTARSFAQNFQQIVRHLWDDAYTWMKHSKGSETINCIDSVLQDGMIMDVNNACNEEISSSMTREFPEDRTSPSLPAQISQAQILG